MSATISHPSSVALSLRWRLTLAMGTLAALVVIIGIAAPMALARLRTEVRDSVQMAGLMSQLAGDVATKAQAARRFDQSYFLNLEDSTARYVYRTRWDSAASELGAAIDNFDAAARTAEDHEQARIWKFAHTLYIEGFHEVAAAVDAGEIRTPHEAATRFSTFEQNIETLSDLSVEFAASKRYEAEQAVQQLDQVGRQINLLVGSLGAISMVAAVGLSFVFPELITRPLAVLSQAAGRLAAGDTGVRVGLRRRDEIGALGGAFDQMAATVEQRTAALEAQFAAAEAAHREAEQARAQVAAQLATIAAQRSAIEEMSVPILPVAAGVLVMPLVGALDSARIAQAQERALGAVEEHRAAFLLIDITGVPVVDTQVARGLLSIVQSTALLGGRAVLVGIRPEVAQTVVGLGIDLGMVVTRATLQDGVQYAAEAAARRAARR